MGTFRFVLALAVLMSHIAARLGPSIINRTSTHILVWSSEAVFAFFIISGFYMSLIINEKYAQLEHGTRRFYLNRALRLYPIHWTLLLLFALGYLYVGAPSFLVGDFRDPLWRWLYAVISSTFFIGVDVLPLVDHDNWKFVIGPTWSLGIESSFYLLAPFIVRRSARTLFALFAAALALRLGLYFSGVPAQPWLYSFFPADFVLFLMGALSYRLYVRVQDWPFAKWLGAAAAALLILCVTTPFLWTSPDLDSPLAWCFYVCVGICTPLLFKLTAGWKIDNLLGQLSYPVFLSHVLVISVVLRSDPYPYDKGLVAATLTLAVSLALYQFIDRPVERIRERIKSGVGIALKPAIPMTPIPLAQDDPSR